MSDNKHWRQRDSAVTPHGYGRPHDPTYGPVWVRGQNATLWDANGKDYIDLTSGYSALNFGHVNQELISVASSQMQLLTHLTQQPSLPRIELAERLARIAPLRLPAKCLLNVNGSRAVETAWKIAYHRRPGRLIYFDGSYHGRSLSTAWLTQTDRSLASTPAELPIGVPYPPAAIHDSEGRAAREISNYIKSLGADRHNDISGIIVEPALGARGYYFPHPNFFQQLREIADQYSWAIICDEIQMGLGRAGGMFLCQRQQWQPDIVVLGKSLGGGLVPISATLAPAEWMDAFPAGVESETFAGNPVACAIALAVLDKLERSDLILRGSQAGLAMRLWLENWITRQPSYSKDDTDIQHYFVDGCGANAVLEVSPRRKGQQAEVITDRLARLALQNGVLLQRSGLIRERIVMIPPLTISPEELALVQVRLEAAWGVDFA